MRSKIFRPRFRSGGCGCGGDCKRSLQAKAVVPAKFTTREDWPSFLTAPHSRHSAFSAVNESLSYRRHMFPRRYRLFFFLEGGEGAESFYAGVPNPRVKCNLTTLLHASAAAVRVAIKCPILFSLRVYVIFMRWQWMGVQRGLSLARETQISKQISAGYWRWWEIDRSNDANALIVRWRG